MVEIPVLGPDLVDVRQIDIIKQEAKKAEQRAELEEETAVTEPETAS
jgi:hypothetical protein